MIETSFILAAFMALVLGIVFVAQTLFVRQIFVERANEAARWGAVTGYDPQAIRNIVRYGTATPDEHATPFMGLPASEIVVGNPGCPGAQCRVSVAIPAQGIHNSEPAQPADTTRASAPSRP